MIVADVLEHPQRPHDAATGAWRPWRWIRFGLPSQMPCPSSAVLWLTVPASAAQYACRGLTL